MSVKLFAFFMTQVSPLKNRHNNSSFFRMGMGINVKYVGKQLTLYYNTNFIIFFNTEIKWNSDSQPGFVYQHYLGTIKKVKIAGCYPRPGIYVLGLWILYFLWGPQVWEPLLWSWVAFWSVLPRYFFLCTLNVSF